MEASKVISVIKSVAPLGGMFFDESILIGITTCSHGAASSVSSDRVISGGLISRVIWIDALAEQPFESTIATVYVPESRTNIVSVVAPVLQIWELNMPESVRVSTPPVSALPVSVLPSTPSQSWSMPSPGMSFAPGWD